MRKMDSSRKTWDFKELRELCAEKGLPDSKIYQEALLWKQWRASYHAEQYQKYQEMLEELFPPQTRVDKEKWIYAQHACGAHVEAAAQALHSMADILAQIINKVVLCDDLAEGDVALRNIADKDKNKRIPSKIIAAIDKLLNSAEFRYVDAFVNTIKHRRLLKTTYHLEYGRDKRNEKAVRFQKFEYKGDCYGFTLAIDIIGPYKSCIVELICEIGNAVNDYLQNVS